MYAHEKGVYADEDGVYAHPFPIRIGLVIIVGWCSRISMLGVNQIRVYS